LGPGFRENGGPGLEHNSLESFRIFGSNGFFELLLEGRNSSSFNFVVYCGLEDKVRMSFLGFFLKVECIDFVLLVFIVDFDRYTMVEVVIKFEFCRIGIVSWGLLFAFSLLTYCHHHGLCGLLFFRF
jgi:hypothetical protein